MRKVCKFEREFMLLNSMSKLGKVIVDKPGDKLKHI